MPSKRRRSSIFSKTPREWCLRILLTTVAAAIGLVSLCDTLANLVVKADPGRAHAMAPWNGIITAAFAKEGTSLGFATVPNADQVRLARTALQQDATNPEAL